MKPPHSEIFRIISSLQSANFSKSFFRVVYSGTIQVKNIRVYHVDQRESQVPLAHVWNKLLAFQRYTKMTWILF